MEEAVSLDLLDRVWGLINALAPDATDVRVSITESELVVKATRGDRHFVMSTSLENDADTIIANVARFMTEPQCSDRLTPELLHRINDVLVTTNVEHFRIEETSDVIIVHAYREGNGPPFGVAASIATDDDAIVATIEQWASQQRQPPSRQ